MCKFLIEISVKSVLIDLPTCISNNNKSQSSDTKENKLNIGNIVSINYFFKYFS